MSEIQKHGKLQRFPDKPRNKIRSYLVGVFRLINGGAKKKKDLRTVLSRQIHFLWFCHQHDLLELLFAVKTAIPDGNFAVFSPSFVDTLTEKFEQPETETLNLVLAAYAMYLATGHTILSQSIKSGTISSYLKDAADFISRLDTTVDRDARKTDKGTMYEGIQKVIGEVKRLEKVPERREGYTIAMHRQLCENTRLRHQDDKVTVVRDWCTVGLQGGFRRSEYCQIKSSGLLHNYDVCPLGGPTAFALDDIQFFSRTQSQLDRSYALSNPDCVYFIKVWFRWQKNGFHNIFRWFARNDEKPFLCGVSAWIRIVERYIRLVGTSNDKPLAVYKHEGTGFPRYLTSTIVTIEMRILAQSVHGITKKEDLQRFSCHSLRVGACNIYFASGVSPEVIKRVLRWESDAWRQYVRDLRCTAVQVVTSMNTADNLPIM